jgi:predicted Rdx family selenoprotein
MKIKVIWYSLICILLHPFNTDILISTQRDGGFPDAKVQGAKIRDIIPFRPYEHCFLLQ